MQDSLLESIYLLRIVTESKFDGLNGSIVEPKGLLK